MHTGVGHFIQDQPVASDKEDYRLEDKLRYLSTPSHKEIIMVTPYLIPGDCCRLKASCNPLKFYFCAFCAFLRPYQV
jgi:hypothetical protein